MAAATFLSLSAGYLGYRALDLAGAAQIYPSVVWFSLAVLLLAHVAYLSRSEIEEFKHVVQELDGRGWLRLGGFTLVWLVYAYVLSRVGFLIATSAALTMSMLVLRSKPTFLRAILLALTFFALTVIFFLVLQVILNIPLPQKAFDRILSDWAYSTF